MDEDTKTSNLVEHSKSSLELQTAPWKGRGWRPVTF